MARGGWQLKGPWASGPLLGVWGSNANAFSCPNLYTHPFPFFLMCGTMFPQNFSFAGDVAARWASDAIAMRPSRGCGVHRIVDHTRALKET